MSRTLYLHIGSHKTGTTSIQQFLSEKRKSLLARGILYPVSDNNLNLGGVLGRTESDQGSDDEPAARRVDKVIQTITAVDVPVVVASSEGFSYLFDRPSIAAYHERLSAHFSTIKIICYLRRQDQFAISHHQEGANPQSKPAAQLHGHALTALPGKTEAQHKYLDYETRIGHWADLFGDDAMVVRVYDRAKLKDGDSVSDFLEIVGLSDLEREKSPPKNVSMGLVQVKMGHLLHGILTDPQIRSSVLHRLPTTDRMTPPRKDAEAFVAPYVAGNRRLNARLKVSGEASMFSEDFSMYSVGGNELWTEQTADFAIRACADVIEFLSKTTAVFSKDDYMAAAKALKAENAGMAARFMAAALGMNPRSERVKAKGAKLEKRHQKKEARTTELDKAKPPKAARAGIRAQKRLDRATKDTPAQ